MSWYRKAAEGGELQAQYNDGVCCAKGIGVSRSMKEAVKWFQMAAGNGFAVAQLALGSCYATGDGIEQSNEKALYWYHKAAEQEQPDAMLILGNCYMGGLVRASAERRRGLQVASQSGGKGQR